MPACDASGLKSVRLMVVPTHEGAGLVMFASVGFCNSVTQAASPTSLHEGQATGKTGGSSRVIVTDQFMLAPANGLGCSATKLKVCPLGLPL